MATEQKSLFVKEIKDNYAVSAEDNLVCKASEEINGWVKSNIEATKITLKYKSKNLEDIVNKDVIKLTDKPTVLSITEDTLVGMLRHVKFSLKQNLHDLLIKVENYYG